MTQAYGLNKLLWGKQAVLFRLWCAKVASISNSTEQTLAPGDTFCERVTLTHAFCFAYSSLWVLLIRYYYDIVNLIRY